MKKILKIILLMSTFILFSCNNNSNIELKNINFEEYVQIYKEDVEIFYVSIDCPHCLNHLKENKSNEKMKYIFYGENNIDSIKNFLIKNNIKGKAYIDKEYEVFKTYNIKYFPTKLK